MTKRFGFTLAEGAKHAGICDNARREAFTLAEVLITLGIIGVVAAMTIPTLISNTNGAQFKTGYKKALSSLNQAALMNLALADYDFASVVKYAEDSDGKPVEKTIELIRFYMLNGPLQRACINIHRNCFFVLSGL